MTQHLSPLVELPVSIQIATEAAMQTADRIAEQLADLCSRRLRDEPLTPVEALRIRRTLRDETLSALADIRAALVGARRLVRQAQVTRRQRLALLAMLDTCETFQGHAANLGDTVLTIVDGAIEAREFRPEDAAKLERLVQDTIRPMLAGARMTFHRTCVELGLPQGQQ